MGTGNKSARVKVLLVLGAGASESDPILADLQARGEFQLLKAANSDLAEALLRDSPISLALACPEMPALEIERLVAAVERSKRSIPVLASRSARSGDAERWAELGVGVLRSPLLPGACALGRGGAGPEEQGLTPPVLESSLGGRLLSKRLRNPVVSVTMQAMTLERSRPAMDSVPPEEEGETSPEARPDQESVFAAGGEMGALIRATDWSATALGPVSAWPQSLRTAINIMLESGFGMVVAWGPQFRFFYNDRYRPVLGATKHPGALGAPASEIFPEAWPFIGPLFNRTRNGESVALDDVLIPLNRNGYLENCYFTLSYSPIRDETGGVGGMLAVVAETTARVEGERRLATLRDLARRAADAKSVEQACENAASVLANNPIDVPFALLYLLDPGGKKARLATLAGLAAGHPCAPSSVDLAEGTDLSGWPLSLACEGRPVVVRDLGQRFGPLPAGPYPEATHCAVALPLATPGQEHPYGILVAGVSPRRALDDPYSGFFDLAADQVVTAIRNARTFEEERRRAEALEVIDRAKTAFFSNVSHEFRTPLTLMLEPLDDLLRGAPGITPEQRELVAVAHRNSLRLLKLVNSLLDFSRIEAGRVRATYQRTDLATVTADLASVFRSAVERAGLRLRVSCAPVEGAVYVDRDMWEKIVLNLISNAFKFTFEGEIAVSLQRAGSAVELRVEDTGIGIPEDELARIFDRFHRVEGARGRTQEGTGIGLALVHELVKLHGGTVRAESAGGRGSRFIVSIPLGTAHLPADRIGVVGAASSTALGATPFVEEALRWVAAPIASLSAAPEVPPLPGASAPRPQRARILLADDNADMREYLHRLLSVHWNVEAVADGEEALAIARARPPDLVLSDVMMPRLDGFGLLHQLRSGEATAAIPVILLSARAGEEAQVEGRGAGADDYVVKPFSGKELLARVQSQLALARLRQIDRAHRNELRRLFMSAPVFIGLLRGPQHVFELANGAFRQMAGNRELIGKPVREAFPEGEGQGFLGLLDRVFVTGESFSGKEVPIRLRPGPDTPEEETFVTFSYEPFRDADGGIGGIAVFGFDVSEMVRARRTAEDLARRAQLADRRKDEFLAMLGHELRNPLAPIATAVQLMKLRGGGTDREREVIERQVGYLSRLVDDLLDVSRIASGKIELQRRDVELAEIVYKAIEIASPLLEQKRQQLFVQVPRAGLRVNGDPMRLAQVVANLLTNAARYTPPAGHVSVIAERQGSEAVLRVKDDGMGIAREMLPTIFDLFVQGPRALDRAQGGLGLGLALVRNLVSLHGGAVSASSEGPDRGSEFVVRLPALEGSRESLDWTPDPLAQRAATGKRILVVDDNEDAAAMLAEALRVHGHEVSVAHDGPRALALLKERPVEVGILDLGLPVMDGYELARRIRELTHGAPMGLIALTGYGQENDRARTREAGFDLHLVKPVDMGVILAAVRGPLI